MPLLLLLLLTAVRSVPATPSISQVSAAAAQPAVAQPCTAYYVARLRVPALLQEQWSRHG